MEIKNSLIKKEEDINKIKFSVFLSQNAIKNKINEMVGSKDGQRFITSMLSVVSNNPKLAECNNTTILSSCLIGEALKLPMSPQLGYYYIIPYENTQTGESEAQFQIGYKGLIQLAIRTGQYKHINVVAIKQGELINYNLLTEEFQTRFIEDDEIREKTETIGYFAMFETITGFKKSMYWSKKKMLLHADKYSQSFHLHETITKKNFKIVSFAEYEKNKSKYENSKLYSSNWYKNFDDMAFKTMLKQLLSKWGIMSVEMQEAVNKDMGVIREDGTVDYVDNLPNKYNEDNKIIETHAEVKEEIKNSQEDLSEGF